MKIFNKKAIYILPLAAAMSLTACIDEESPTQQASADQVASSSTSLSMLVSGLKSKMISYCNYYSDVTSWYASQDWGYGCYMLTKETMLDGFPTTGSTWNYQTYYESATRLTSYTAPVYFFYYNLADLANKIMKSTEGATSETMLNYRGIAHTYRALAYMDLALMFEFWPTGNSDLDTKAKDIMGLTVPIVTESTTAEEAKNNPRADFPTMYRFIYSDLSKAKELLAGYERTEKNDVNIDVVNGLLARFWLTVATRFQRYPNDLPKQLEAEGANDGYADLGITSAADCYKKAEDCAKAVINAGYTPMTKEQWHDVKSGFNTANQAWVWDMRITSTEQYSYYWNSIMGNVASEPTWALPAYGGEYRCISADLYSYIQDGDWRKTSWIAPEDAGSKTVPEKYQTQLKDETASSKSASTNFSRLPAYANLKFRPGSGSLEDEQTGMLVDIPLMRVEEMYFIVIECEYYLIGEFISMEKLENFMNKYRFDEGKRYTAENTDSYIIELKSQKYIELWGEGIMYNDYKRLGLPILRDYEGSNYVEPYNKLNHEAFGCAQWLNFYIPEVARTYNSALSGKMNPDPTPTGI
ncbi:MAG: RagB/SusD family nutrient uptake outer membrane protein [Prevotella sp.]